MVLVGVVGVGVVLVVEVVVVCSGYGGHADVTVDVAAHGEWRR